MISSRAFYSSLWFFREIIKERRFSLNCLNRYNMTFTKRDIELFDILKQATKSELLTLSQIISKKWSSNIDEFCTDPYKIAKEMQLMGGNSMVNTCRRHGVSYRELAFDAAKKSGAKVYQGDSVSVLEWELLKQLLHDLEQKLSDEDKAKFFDEINKKGQNLGFDKTKDSFKFIAQNPGFYTVILDLILPYLLRTIGISYVAMLGGSAIAGAIPIIGWGAAAGSLMYSASGTAFSVTIPCTAIVGSIRARLDAEKSANDFSGAFV